MRNPTIAQGRELRLQFVSLESGDLPVNDTATSANSSESSESPRDRIERVQADLSDIESFYKVQSSPSRYKRLDQQYQTELSALENVPFDELDQDGKVDHLLLKNYLTRSLRNLKHGSVKDNQVFAFLGAELLGPIVLLIEARQRVDPIDAQKTAQELADVTTEILSVKKRIVDGNLKADPTIALRATKILEEFKGHLEEWNAFYQDYDPLFTWWMAEPYKSLNQNLADLSDTIKRVVLHIEPDDTDTIIGEPIGRDALLDEFKAEMIPYTPEELIQIGEKEYAWCESEMLKAASELGYSDWRSALEHVKNLYVPPGSQPTLVHSLIHEATSYVQTHNLVTVPPISSETLQTFMMTPSAQKLNPFFLGGTSLIISYPTSTMPHPDKLMSLRGNNKHFARATVFHEMILGHHLHMHYAARHRSYRQLFTTPFCIEGWAFYWEMLLYSSPSWQKSPEDKIGMLFWRMHRCIRIVFSLQYHLGLLAPQECIEMLVERVGHERATAEGEVRRSIMGGYSPLYQAGYMLGGLQIWGLRKEIVEGGSTGVRVGRDKVGEKRFHDTFLKANFMPVELFRALIKGEKLDRDFKTKWRFYDL